MPRKEDYWKNPELARKQAKKDKKKIRDRILAEIALHAGEEDYQPPSLQIGASLRYSILKRDGFACFYCGARPPAILEVDHVTPQAKGGKTVPDNLVTACRPCNRGKMAK